MTPQSTFMIIATIRAGEVDALRSFLATMNSAPGVVDPRQKIIPLGNLDRLHVARLMILDTDTAEDVEAHGVEPRPWEPRLVLLGDCDGPHDTFLAELAVRAEPGLKRLFEHCEDFSPDGTLLSWLLEHNVSPAANYVNYRGRTVRQVKEEAELHAFLRHELATLSPTLAEGSDGQLHRHLRDAVDKEIGAGRLTLTKPAATPLVWWLKNAAHLIGIPLLLLLMSPLLLVAAPFFLVFLRFRESRDPEIAPRPDTERTLQLAEQEDQFVTNPFSAFGDVKPGLFRRYTLLILLTLLDYGARHIYNRGYLTRVQTIHFARWVLLDDKHRLLFASNYDGSLESYMDDFINKVAWGLNLVFSNGVGYPRTRWMLKGGAEREQKFKYYLRRHQRYTDVWYKAYPDLTAVDLGRNAKIREGLERRSFTDRYTIRDWLGLI